MKKAIYTNDGTIVTIVDSFNLDRGDIIANGIRYANCMSIDCTDDVQTGDYKVINGVVTYVPIVQPVVIPQQVLAYQAKEALILSGIMPAQIEIIINGLASPTKELAMNQWLNAPTFKRYNSWISQLSPLIPLTDVQLDDLFVLAETL